MSVEMWVVPVLLALLVAILCVLVFLLFWHQPRVELPAEWQDKLRALESLSQATQLAVAKNDGAMHGLAQQMQGFTQNMQSTLEASRQAVAGRLEESSKALLAHLAQGQADAGTARKELSETLVGFRTELTTTVGTLAAESVKSRQAMAESAVLFETRIQERF